MFSDIRNLLSYIKENHGGIFRKVAFSSMLEPLIKLKAESQRRNLRLKQADEKLMELDRLRDHLAYISETFSTRSRTLNSLNKTASEKNFSSTEEHEKNTGKNSTEVEPYIPSPVNSKDEKKILKTKPPMISNLKSSKNTEKASTPISSHKIDLWHIKLSGLTRNKNSREDLINGIEKNRLRSSICLTEPESGQKQEDVNEGQINQSRIYNLNDCNAASNNFLSVMPSPLAEVDIQTKLNTNLAPNDMQTLSRRSSTTSMKQIINRKMLLKDLNIGSNSTEAKVNFGIENEAGESFGRKNYSVSTYQDDKEDG